MNQYAHPKWLINYLVHYFTQWSTPSHTHYFSQNHHNIQTATSDRVYLAFWFLLPWIIKSSTTEMLQLIHSIYVQTRDTAIQLISFSRKISFALLCSTYDKHKKCVWCVCVWCVRVCVCVCVCVCGVVWVEEEGDGDINWNQHKCWPYQQLLLPLQTDDTASNTQTDSCANSKFT